LGGDEKEIFAWLDAEECDQDDVEV